MDSAAPEHANAPDRRRVNWSRAAGPAAGLACALLFIAAAVVWEGRASYPLTWGDSAPNGSQAQMRGLHLQRISVTEALLSAEPFDNNLRAPLHFVAAATWSAALGGDHLILVLFQTTTLALAGLLLMLVLRRETRSWPAALVGLALFYSAPETVIQAHSFFLEVSVVLWAAFTLWALHYVSSGSRWGPLLLGLGLGGAMLSRHHAAVALVTPVAIYALPSAITALRRHPLALAPAILALPLAAALLSLALGRAWSESPKPPGVSVSSTWSYSLLLLLLVLGLGAVHARLRPALADPRAARGRDLCQALSLGLAMALPWYLTFMGDVASHYQGSSTPGLLDLRRAPPLIAFEYLCLGLRLLTPVGFPLLLVGAAAAVRRPRPTTTLCLVGLLWANVAFPFYFHARYNFILLVFALPLVLGWVAARRPLVRRAVYAVLLLFGLIRFAGWALPLPLAPLDPEEMRTESIAWWARGAGDFWPSVRAWAHPLMTLAPTRTPDQLGMVSRDVEQACGQARTCPLMIPEPPRELRPYALVGDISVVRYYLDLVHPGERVQFVPRPVAGHAVFLLLITWQPSDAEAWRQQLPGRQVQLVRRYSAFGGMHAVLIKGLPR